MSETIVDSTFDFDWETLQIKTFKLSRNLDYQFNDCKLAQVII